MSQVGKNITTECRDQDPELDPSTQLWKTGEIQMKSIVNNTATILFFIMFPWLCKMLTLGGDE